MENENNEQNLNVEPEVAQGTYTDQVVYTEPVEQIPVEQVPVEEVPTQEIPAEGVPMEEVPIQEAVAQEAPVHEMTEEEYQAKLEEKKKEIIEKRNKRTKIGVACICLGFLVMIIGLCIAVANQQKGKGYIATKGTVIEVNTKATSEGEAYAPSVRFSAEGNTFEYVSTDYTTEKTYTVGEEINLKYDPDDPNEVILGVGKTSPVLFIIAVILLIVGVIFSRI